jgi:hypothetical protein
VVVPDEQAAIMPNLGLNRRFLGVAILTVGGIVLTFLAWYIAFSIVGAIPWGEWLIANYHEPGHLRDWRRAYREGDVVFPRGRVIVNLGVTSLAGAIKMYRPAVSLEGLGPCRVTDWQNIPIPGTILDDGSQIRYRGPFPPEESGVGDIQFNLPADEGMYGKIIPLHYSAHVSRPVLVDARHFAWQDTYVQRTLSLTFGTRRQAWILAVIHAANVIIAAGCVLAGAIYLALAYRPKRPKCIPALVRAPFRCSRGHTVLTFGCPACIEAAKPSSPAPTAQTPSR